MQSSNPLSGSSSSTPAGFSFPAPSPTSADLISRLADLEIELKKKNAHLSENEQKINEEIHLEESRDRKATADQDEDEDDDETEEEEESEEEEKLRAAAAAAGDRVDDPAAAHSSLVLRPMGCFEVSVYVCAFLWLILLIFIVTLPMSQWFQDFVSTTQILANMPKCDALRNSLSSQLSSLCFSDNSGPAATFR